MVQAKVSYSIHIVLEGISSSHSKIFFVDINFPIDEKSYDKVNMRFEEWDNDNHKIITWIINTSAPTISRLFKYFDSPKGV